MDRSWMTAYPSPTFSKRAFGAELRSPQKSSGSVADDPDRILAPDATFPLSGDDAIRIIGLPDTMV